MRKRPKSEKPERRVKARDVIVVFLSLVALVGLAGILLISGRDNQRAAEELSGQRNQLDAAVASRRDTPVLRVNEVNAAGWVELYNSGDAEAELDGYTLLMNGEPLMVFTQGSAAPPGGYTLADVKLSFLPDVKNVLSLQNADGGTVDTFILPVLGHAESYGRVADGEAGFALMAGTMGTSNKGAEQAKPKGVTFSAPGGFYGEEMLLELTAPAGCDIYYTTDGTKPSAASQRYETPISLQNESGTNYRYATARGVVYEYNYVPGSIYMGTVVRAVAVSAGKPVGDEITQSYFISIGESVALAGAPALSVTVDPESLFDYYKGIYVQGRTNEDNLAMGMGGGTGNYRQDWMRHAHIEFYEAEKGKTYEADVELGILQDFSVAGPQKSFRITMAGQKVSMGSALYPFIGTDGRSLELHTYEKDNHYKFRQATAYELLQGSAVGTPALTPCNVFINGEHWGVYLLQQPYDEKYVAQTYGVPQDEVVTALDSLPKAEDPDTEEAAEEAETEAEADTAETPPAEPTGQEMFDELVAFVVDNDMSDDENFSIARAQMDMDSYLECFCANMYLANTDYKKEGLTVWRSRAEGGAGHKDGRWRWLMPKLDNSTANGLEGEKCSYSINTFLQPEVTQDAFLASLFANGEFRTMFSKKMRQMGQERFAPERALDALDRTSALMEQKSLNSYLRFVGKPTETFFSSEVEKVAEFFKQRGGYIGGYTQEVLTSGMGPEKTDETDDTSETARVNVQPTE